MCSTFDQQIFFKRRLQRKTEIEFDVPRIMLPGSGCGLRCEDHCRRKGYSPRSVEEQTGRIPWGTQPAALASRPSRQQTTADILVSYIPPPQPPAILSGTKLGRRRFPRRPDRSVSLYSVYHLIFSPWDNLAGSPRRDSYMICNPEATKYRNRVRQYSHVL